MAPERPRSRDYHFPQECPSYYAIVWFLVLLRCFVTLSPAFHLVEELGRLFQTRSEASTAGPLVSLKYISTWGTN